MTSFCPKKCAGFRKTGQNLLVFLVIALGLGFALPGLAATPDDGRLPSVLFDQRPQSLVLEIQRRLQDMGLYGGSLDGRLNPETEQAIRHFQRRTGQDATGEPSQALLNTLQAGGRVDDLLSRLDKARTSAQQEAREALLANPETEDLLNQASQKVPVITADESRACFDKPTPKCLLRIAFGETPGIDKDERRDWALGEILVAQARAGLLIDARLTARHIQDPRLILVALRNIAEALAAGGQLADALTTAATISDAERRAEGLNAVVVSYSAPTNEQSQNALDLLAKAIDQIEDPRSQALYRLKLAKAEADAKQPDAAEQSLIRAASALQKPKATALRGKALKDYEAGLRQLAETYSALGNAEKAYSLAQQIKGEAERTSALVQIANDLATTGKIAEAINMANKIKPARYHSVILAKLSEIQAQNGDLGDARRSLEKAQSVASAIKFPFALDFARSKITQSFLALAMQGDDDAWDKASALADTIKDRKLRAQLLWLASVKADRINQPDRKNHFQNLAEAATEDVISRISRVWIHVDMALDHQRYGEKAKAKKAIMRGQLVAEGITDPWSRARALARVASGMISLERD